MCQSGGRKRSWLWNRVRKRWRLARAWEVVAPVSFRRRRNKPTPQRGFWGPTQSPQVALVGIAVMTPCSQPAPVSLCYLSYIPPIPVATHRNGCGSAPMWWEDSQKSPSIQVHPCWERSGTISAQWTPLLPPGWASSGWRPGVRNLAHQPGFSSAFGEWWEISAVSNPIQRHLSPVAPVLEVLVVPTEAEWGCETVALPCFPSRGKTPWEASGKDLQSIQWSSWTWE